MENEKDFIAHKYENKEQGVNKEQRLVDHLENTANICRDFSLPIFKDIAWWCGYYHDIGKYSLEFQEKIRGKNIQVSHADCGAYEIDKKFGGILFKYMLEYCIAGHHTGLQDGGTDADNEADTTLKGMINSKHCDYSSFKTEVSDIKIDFNDIAHYFKKYCKSNDYMEELTELFAFSIRYIYSCLTDADFIDTERFFNNNAVRGDKADFEEALNRLNLRLSKFGKDTDIRKVRGELQKQALQNLTVELKGLILYHLGVIPKALNL